MSKRPDSLYRSGPAPRWLVQETDACPIVRDANGRRSPSSIRGGARTVNDGRQSRAAIPAIPCAALLPISFSDLLILVLFRHQHGARRVHAGVAWTCCLFFGSFP